MYMAMAASCFIVAMGLIILHAGRFRRDGTLLWIVGWVFQGASWALIGLRGLMWNFVSIVVANTFLTGSFSLHYAAVRQFQDRVYNWETLFLPPAATFAFYWYFLPYADDISYRIIFISLLSVLQIIAIIGALFWGSPIKERRSCRLTGFAFFLLAVIFFTRLLERVISSYRHVSVLDPTAQYATGIVVVGVVILSSLGFMLMIQERAAEMLTANQALLRTVIESTPDCLSMKDREGRYVMVNSATANSLNQATGISAAEFIGKKDDDIFPPEVARQVMDMDQKVITSGEMRTYDHSLLVGGDSRIFSTIKSAYIDAARNIAGVVSVSRDITERVRAEEDRKSLEVRLQRMEKMEALGTLAGGVAHDLNNILSGIIGYPDLILTQLPDDSPLKESILAIKRSGQKAAAVVQGLMTLARRGMVSLEVMNWNNVISEYMKSPEQEKIQSLHPNVRFEVLLESDLLPIKGSRVHLSNTLMNLLSNAAEAIPERGVVTILTRNQYLDRPVKGYDDMKEGDYVILEVSDPGRGIPTEDMGRIFEPFYTGKMKGRSGTGLGLAVVWGTLRDHNGYIDVQSEEGRGTTFTLYFPVTREPLTLDHSPISLSDYMGKGETILVVDDVREQRDLVVAMLNKLNYRAMSVSSGEAAIETAEIWQPDLLILDMIMEPGIDGLETYRRILELRPGQKAIIVSGSPETERVRQVLDLGAGAFVKKPYSLEKIGQVVRQELDKCSLYIRNH